MGVWLKVLAWPKNVVVALCSALVGCTQVLGIDGEYTLDVTASGGAHHGSGGALNKGGGGALGGGGGVPIDGAGGLASETCGGTACSGATKCCTFPQPDGGVIDSCVQMAPIVGCAQPGCDVHCGAPVNGTATCTADGLCGHQCNEGYRFAGNDGGCDPISTGAGGRGGLGGAPGAGGAASTCVATGCPGCIPVGPFGCCKSDGTCGCTWAPGAICY